jgi:Ser/Thr protein kinase RdoA (MazF antagonist)
LKLCDTDPAICPKAQITAKPINEGRTEVISPRCAAFAVASAAMRSITTALIQICSGPLIAPIKFKTNAAISRQPLARHINAKTRGKSFKLLIILGSVSSESLSPRPQKSGLPRTCFPSTLMGMTSERTFAKIALTHFGLSDANLQLILQRATAIYRVIHPGMAQQYVLRLHHPNRHPIICVQSELVYLKAICENTDLRVPEPVAATDGQLLGVVTLNGEQRYASLFKWVPGKHKQQNLTVKDGMHLGIALGKLHAFTATWQPPPNFARWDFAAEEALDLEKIIKESVGLLSQNDLRDVAQAIEVAQSTLGMLRPTPHTYGLIHADANPGNFLHLPNQAAILDFEVCSYGYFLYDLGRLAEEIETSLKQRSQFTQALLSGYAKIRVLPPDAEAQVRAFSLLSALDTIVWLCAQQRDIAWIFNYRNKLLARLRQLLLKPQVGT